MSSLILSLNMGHLVAYVLDKYMYKGFLIEPLRDDVVWVEKTPFKAASES
jgi:hypothetical protein